jgi:DNA-binding GntR family transcriptional regulator
MIQRKPLRDEIQKEIIARIADGRLSGGHRINETHLAEDLGISRTPLREAMITLGAAGFLRSDMGKGFLVPALDAKEFTDLQGILKLLAPEALSLTGQPAPGRLMELGNLLGRARLPRGQGLALDEAIFRWTWLLVEDCPNSVLRAEVLRLDGLSRRYWRTVVESGLDPAPLLLSYAALYELLRNKKMPEAREAWAIHFSRFGGMAESLLAGN